MIIKSNWNDKYLGRGTWNLRESPINNHFPSVCHSTCVACTCISCLMNFLHPNPRRKYLKLTGNWSYDQLLTNVDFVTLWRGNPTWSHVNDSQLTRSREARTSILASWLLTSLATIISALDKFWGIRYPQWSGPNLICNILDSENK